MPTKTGELKGIFDLLSGQTVTGLTTISHSATGDVYSRYRADSPPGIAFSSELEITLYKMPRVDAKCIKKVIFNDPVTVIIWSDDTKTIVRCIEGQPYEPYAGFCAAVVKKLFGSTTRAKKISGTYKKG